MHETESREIRPARPRRQRKVARVRKAIWGSAALLLILLFAVNLPAAPPANPQQVVIPIQGLH